LSENAEITATARLPLKYPAAGTDRTSAPIRKTVRNRFHKEVKCAKGTVSGDTTSFICKAHGQDVDGSPFVGEHVCFMTNTTGMRPYPFGTPGAQEAINRLCMELDSEGSASVEVFCKNQTGNVIADFDDEGISRFDIFDCKQTPLPTTTTTTTTTPSTSTSTPTSTTLPTTTTAPTTTTTTPTDVCPNIPGAQPTLPPGFGIVNGSCVQDVCPNLSGVQTQVPLGFGVVNGDCIADVCPNLGGVQTQVPRGLKKVNGNCVKPPADVCPNLAGAQAKVPTGHIKVQGKCVKKKIIVKKAKKVKRKPPKVCYLNGHPVSPCVRGKG
jgi:hypothetical protein